MTGNPYLDLTARFNRGRVRAILSSGQAVVVHRLAVMSKDGDWIVREDSEALRHVLEALAERGSQYRFGAPLAERWLAGGWSSHLEHRVEGLRLRTDFVTRPPRISAKALAHMWREAESQDLPVVAAGSGREEIERALDEERRALMRSNEERLAVYRAASREWMACWPEVSEEIAGLSLQEAHRIVVKRAAGVLPYSPGERS